MRRTALVLVAASASALLSIGCSGGSRQDAKEPEGTFRMRVVHAVFPLAQVLARPTNLVLSVRNTSAKTVPNVAVTIDSFDYASTYPELSDNRRPVWVIERGPGAIAKPPVRTQEVSPPGGGQTAYVNTWALGPLAPGQVRSFVWNVVPVKPGLHVVHYSIVAGLGGKAKALTLGPIPLKGRFPVVVSKAPPRTHLNPNTGRVEVGPLPTNL